MRSEFQRLAILWNKLSKQTKVSRVQSFVISRIFWSFAKVYTHEIIVFRSFAKVYTREVFQIFKLVYTREIF